MLITRHKDKRLFLSWPSVIEFLLIEMIDPVLDFIDVDNEFSATNFRHLILND